MGYKPEEKLDVLPDKQKGILATGLRLKYGAQNKKDMEALNQVYNDYDRVYGIIPYDYEVYILMDGNKPGNWSFGPLDLSHQPFYVGQGLKGRYLHSMGRGRQLERHCEKTERIVEIMRIGGEFAVKHFIVNYFMTQEKAIVVEKKIMRLIGKKYLTNQTFNHCVLPLIEEDYIRPGKLPLTMIPKK